MARVPWSFLNDRPIIQIEFTLAQGGKASRTLLADTGAGTAKGPFELILEEHDCLLFGGSFAQTVKLSGAYAGSFPRYLLLAEIPVIQFSSDVFAIGVTAPPKGLDGIAGIRFLNRFTYGNFGNPTEFGLET